MSKQIVLIHIPKTGGTYVAGGTVPAFKCPKCDKKSILLDQNMPFVMNNKMDRMPAIWPIKNFGHCTVADDESVKEEGFAVGKSINRILIISRDRLKDYYVFSIVRNPFSWLVSYYSHARGLGDNREGDHYDFKNAKKGFKYLIGVIANREKPWPSRKFLFFQLFEITDEGNLIPDYICRQETLDSDLKYIADKFDLFYKERKKKREGKHKHYKEYYDKGLIKLVENTWGRELHMFGYEFGGIKKMNILGREIDEDQKKMRYEWKFDRIVLPTKNYLILNRDYSIGVPNFYFK